MQSLAEIWRGIVVFLFAEKEKNEYFCRVKKQAVPTTGEFADKGKEKYSKNIDICQKKHY